MTRQIVDDATADQPPEVLERGRRAVMVRRAIPGLALAVAIALIAVGLGHLVPIVGGPVFGITIGVLVAAVLKPGPRFDSGTAFASKRILQASIVVLGSGLSLAQVVDIGSSSLPVMLGTLGIALAGAAIIGRMLRVDANARILIGVGTGICGASAIGAVAAVLDPKEEEVTYSIATIFAFNIVAVMLFPPIGHLLGMSDHSFGLWAGTAVNDTSSVVAAAYSYSPAAGAFAVVVKLTRTLMIIPICLFVGVLHARRQARTYPAARVRLPWQRILPGFIAGFLVMSALDTVGAIPSSWHGSLTELAVFLITVALAGIGLGTRLSRIRQAGFRPLLLGGILWVIVSCSSLSLQSLTGSL